MPILWQILHVYFESIIIMKKEIKKCYLNVDRSFGVDCILQSLRCGFNLARYSKISYIVSVLKTSFYCYVVCCFQSLCLFLCDSKTLAWVRVRVHVTIKSFFILLTPVCSGWFWLKLFSAVWGPRCGQLPDHQLDRFQGVWS